MARTGNRRDAGWDLVGKPDGKGPLARTRRRLNFNILMVLTEKVSEGVDRIDLA